jgi:anthranilate phosphoribosyltransferase
MFRGWLYMKKSVSAREHKIDLNNWWANCLQSLQNGWSISREDARRAWNALWEEWEKIDIELLRNNYIPEKMKLALAFRKVAPLSLMLAPTFLMGLTAKGLSVEELAGLVDSFHDHGWFSEYQDAELPDPDTVYSNGFGGDGVKTINVSTAAMIIAAAAGAPCYKMGSRTYFSHAGSHNFLDLVGVRASNTPDHASKTLRQVGLAYLDGVATCNGPTQNIGVGLALMPNAKELMKVMTYPFRFPILCLNPMSPRRSIRGVSTLATEVPARVIRQLFPYTKRLDVVAGLTPEQRVIDEVSNVGPTKITEYRDGKLRTFMTSPEDWGVRQAETKEIRCTDPWLAAVKCMEIFAGVCHDANKDLLLINAGHFLHIAGKAVTRKEATEKARAAVDDGLALAKLRSWVEASGGEVGVFEMILAGARDQRSDSIKQMITLNKYKTAGTHAPQ